MLKPKLNPDFSRLIAFVQQGVAGVEANGDPGKDFEHYVFEEVMHAVYGNDIWSWWNSKAEY